MHKANVNIILLENGLVVRDMNPGGLAWVYEADDEGMTMAVREALVQAATLLGWSITLDEIEPDGETE